MSPYAAVLTDIEEIRANDRPLVLIVRNEFRPDHTRFVTDDSLLQQVGFVVYPRDGIVRRHFHRPLRRSIIGTPEVLVLRTGRCEIDVYDFDRRCVATRELLPGDIAILITGGHGFRMLEDTTFIEVKQGPYTGVEEKEQF